MLTGNYQGANQHENAAGYGTGQNFHLGISALARTTTSAGGTSATEGHDHSITIPELDVDLDAINGANNSNYPPFIALTYIMKVKADKIGTLGVTLGDSNFNAFTTTGGTTGELSFDTTRLELKAGHPTWSAQSTNIHGFDFNLNKTSSGVQPSAARTSGRALVAGATGLYVNYSGDLGDKTTIDTSGNTKIEVLGPNSHSSADNQIYHHATYHVFNHTSNLASPVSGAPANRVLTINSANGTMKLDNSTIAKINNAGVKAVATKEYVDAVPVYSTTHNKTQKWERLPSGLIMQWGTAITSLSDTITFAQAYTDIPNVQITRTGPRDWNYGAECNVVDLSATGFRAEFSGNNGAHYAKAVNWFAIGY